MRYEELSKGKKVLYSIIAWLLLVVTTGAVWYYNTTVPLYDNGVVLQVFRYDFVTDIVHTLMLLLTALLIVGISETMTRLKRHASERVMSMAFVMGILVCFDVGCEGELFYETELFFGLYGMVAALIFMWAYLREIPYDCFGSKEPWFLVTLWIIPVGAAAGFANRSIGLVLFVFAIVCINYVNKVDHRVFAWMPIGTVSVFLGLAARVLLSAYPSWDFMEPVRAYGSLLDVYLNTMTVLTEAFVYLFPMALVTLAVAALLKGVHNVALGREIAYVLAAAVATWLFMVIIPYRESTTLYQTIVLLLLACAAMCLKLFEKRPAMKLYIYIGCALMWLRAAYIICEELIL